MSAEGYSVRPATPKDVPSLPEVEHSAATLYESVLDATGLTRDGLDRVASVEDFASAQRTGRLWVAADSSDTPVGFALVLELGGIAHLEELDVLPEHGQRGLGSSLLETVCEWARGEGYRAVTLSTFRDVAWNAPFYARRGFEVVEPADVSEDHVRLVEAERRRGLRTDLRVVMRYDTGARAG